MDDLNELKNGMNCIFLCRAYGHELRQRSGEFKGSCPKCGGNDRFYIRESDPSRWFCRQCHPEKPGSGLDLIMEFEKTDFSNALRIYRERFGTGSMVPGLDIPGTMEKNPAQKKGAGAFCGGGDSGTIEPPKEWREAVEPMLDKFQGYLFGECQGLSDTQLRACCQAYDYLEARGLEAQTIYEYDLGYNPRTLRLSVAGVGDITIPAGIVIPCYACLTREQKEFIGESGKGQLLRVKVRTGQDGHKYTFIKGGSPVTLFGADGALSAEKVIYTEGEIDCMTVNQCCGDLGIRAVTFGSHAYCGRSEIWRAWYHRPEHTVITFDNESDPGTAAAVGRSAEKLRAAILEAQKADPEEIRAAEPVIKQLPKEWHDWNDILKNEGAEAVQAVARAMFE